MIMKPKLPLMTARFIVTAMKFDPHKCTKLFELEPTEVQTKGEIKPKWKRPVQYSSWSMETKLARFDSTDAVLQLLLDVIWPKRKQIRNFSTKNKLEVQFLLDISGAGERNFLYDFSPRTIGQIRYFRAPLFLDVY